MALKMSISLAFKLMSLRVKLWCNFELYVSCELNNFIPKQSILALHSIEVTKYYSNKDFNSAAMVTNFGSHARISETQPHCS